MPTLIERAREVAAAESDDYFAADTILYYLNAANQTVVSLGVWKERDPRDPRSITALDDLRKVATTTPEVGDFTETNDRFEGGVTYPSDLKELQHFEYKRIPLRELKTNQLYLLEWGNVEPTQYEGYYHVTDSTGKVFELFLHEDPVGEDIKLYYVGTPTDIGMATEDLPDLPRRLTNAIIYGAVSMMGKQEKNEGLQGYEAQYQAELETNLY